MKPSERLLVDTGVSDLPAGGLQVGFQLGRVRDSSHIEDAVSGVTELNGGVLKGKY